MMNIFLCFLFLAPGIGSRYDSLYYYTPLDADYIQKVASGTNFFASWPGKRVKSREQAAKRLLHFGDFHHLYGQLRGINPLE